MNDKFVTVGELADYLHCKTLGDRNKKLYGIALYQESTDDMLTYVPYEKIDIISEIKAGAVLTKASIGLQLRRNYIISGNDPYYLLADAVDFMIQKGLYCVSSDKKPSFSDNSIIADSVSIANGSVIGEYSRLDDNVVIGENVTIGNFCSIGANTVIGSNTIIDDNVIIGSCCNIGNENFEYCKKNDGWHKIPVVGNVHICNNAVIGGNVVVEKGTIGTTVIGEYTHLENLIQVGHEVKIGSHCHIASCTAFAGWAEIGNYVDIYGQAAVSNKIKVGNNAVLLARSGVDKTVKENTIVSGYPAQNHKQEMRFQAFLRRLFRNEQKRK